MDNVYLDKELAGRIQQIQLLLATNTPSQVKERMWGQIESEMCLQVLFLSILDTHVDTGILEHWIAAEQDHCDDVPKEAGSEAGLSQTYTKKNIILKPTIVTQ